MTAEEPTQQDRCPECKVCGEPAVVRAPFEANGQVHPNVPLCAECYKPPDVLETESRTHTPELITTPADEVIANENMITIKHGPGKQSRLRIPSN